MTKQTHKPPFQYSVMMQRMILIALSVFFIGCSKATTVTSSGEDARDVKDLYIVDCLLPSQIRKLGSMTYATPRRPIRTTSNDCAIRGGEYVEYDRADYRTALKVWLEQAEAGDPEAQNYVGEIFEKGLGQEPDFISAVKWYKQAADQGFSRAQINLGYMYEQGLGVEKDITIALNYYRLASGIEEDELILNSTAKQQIADAKAELESQLSLKGIQVNALKQSLFSMQEKLVQLEHSDAQTELAALKNEISALENLYAQAEQEKQLLANKVDGLALAYRGAQDQPILTPEDINVVSERVLKNINFGRYFALIIGNEDYTHLEALRSPLDDAKKLKSILESQYGFTTIVLPNANEKIILNALNDLGDQLTQDDNLLVYYAGHGSISKSSSTKQQRGYWLPVDARPDSESISHWLNNAVINDHLDRLKARSILVIADSCYAGQMGAESSSFLFGTSTTLSEKAIKSGLSHRSRVVISSGGEKPVLDGTSEDHSVFAMSLFDVLENNSQVMRDSMLFSQLAVNVKQRNRVVKLKQNPEMKPIRSAGHEGGSFYFVPN